MERQFKWINSLKMKWNMQNGIKSITMAMAFKEDNKSFENYDGPDHPNHKLLQDPSKFIKYERNSIQSC